MSNAKKKKEIAAKKANAAKNRKGKGKAPLSPSNKKLNNSAPGTKAGKKGRQKNKEKRRERNKR